MVQAGKLRQKRNSFRDFIAVAQALIASGRTSARQLVIEGSSAGGLLIAGVLNSRPDLFRGAVASVPFVDVLASMQDEDLPLTTFEYEEWGNPADPADFQYIASYSPVDSVKQAQYPPVLITVGLQDPRVPYWEGCLWATQLRRASMGETEVLVRVNFGSGHSGASGRYESCANWRSSRLSC
ncbi:MAG: prolyl oligopeptidase family serine peptidase [Verrucomicrobia bacterium]|nr:prolyl oligopeptidase family serine peptidase [Verrucomicrobiota bacterium]